jgi:hypothetical protein
VKITLPIFSTPIFCMEVTILLVWCVLWFGCSLSFLFRNWKLGSWCGDVGGDCTFQNGRSSEVLSLEGISIVFVTPWVSFPESVIKNKTDTSPHSGFLPCHVISLLYVLWLWPSTMMWYSQWSPQQSQWID